MKTGFIISFLVHVAILAIIIIFSADAIRANLPSVGESVRVSMYKELPRGMRRAQKPSLEVPAAAVDNTPMKEEPVKLSSITKKEKLAEKKETTAPKTKKPKEETSSEQPKEEPKQSGEGTSPSGSSVDLALSDGSGTGDEYANGPLGEYYRGYDREYATNKIAQNWTNPVRSNSVISCVIYFQIAKSGEIQGVTVKKSSGNELFDRYAEMAVKATRNLPPLPQSFPDNEVLGVNLTFTHRP